MCYGVTTKKQPRSYQRQLLLVLGLVGAVPETTTVASELVALLLPAMTSTR